MTSFSRSKRASHAQLPGSEIADIAAAEMQRPLRADKIGVHYVEFDAITALCEHLDAKAALFQPGDQKPEDILEAGAQLLDVLVLKLLSKEPTGQRLHLLRAAYKYLSEEDVPKPADLMFVFGGRTPLRINKAIELYNTGLAPRMLVSGRGPFYGPADGVTEARRYAETAMTAGIPESAIMIEDKSITLVDNIRRSLNLLEETGEHLRSLIIVNSPYVQRRGWCMWRKYLADDIKIYRVNSTAGPNLTAEQWYRNEEGIRVVLGEFVKLRNAVAFDSV